MTDPFGILPGTIETPRLFLRALSFDDTASIYSYSSDPEVARYTLWAAHTSETSARAFLAGLLHPTVLAWAICARETRTVIGMVFLHSHQKRHEKAELAFNLARAVWGKGYATEAARAVISFGFAQLGLHRIEATCMPANAASRAVLKKAGMSAEGTMRQSHFRHDGFHDMELFAVIRKNRVDAVITSCG